MLQAYSWNPGNLTFGNASGNLNLSKQDMKRKKSGMADNGSFSNVHGHLLYLEKRAHSGPLNNTPELAAVLNFIAHR